MPGWTINLLVTIALIAPNGDVFSCQPNPPTEWLVGDKFIKATTAPSFSITWMEAELRQELQNASRSTGIAVLVDRRIDPGQKISLALTDVSFEQFLWTIADQAGAGVIRLDNLFYLAPSDTIATIQQRLLNLELETKRLNRVSEIRKGLMTGISIRNETPVEPRTLIAERCRDLQIPVHELNLVPHDLWPAIDLPYLELWQAVSLLLSGFDLAISVSDEHGLTIVPAIKPETAVYRIPTDVLARTPLSRISAMDGVTVTKDSGAGMITGTPDAIFAVMREIARYSANEKIANKPDTREALSLHVKASRGRIAATVAQMLKIRLVFSEQDRELLETIVEVNLDNVSAEELLNTSLNGSGLKYTITDTELRIHKDRQ